MQVRYDKEADAAYIRLSGKHPQGAVELDAGVILHLTEDDKIVAIEILDASKRFPVKNLFKYQIALS